MTTNIAFASFDLMLITVLSDIDPIVLEDEPRPLKRQTLYEVYHQTGVRDNAELGLVRATTLSENLGIQHPRGFIVGWGAIHMRSILPTPTKSYLSPRECSAASII